MGCYDTVNFETRCPACGAKLCGFQSKDGECNFERIELNEVLNAVDICGCGVIVSLDRKAPVQDNRPPATLVEALDMGFRVTISK